VRAFAVAVRLARWRASGGTLDLLAKKLKKKPITVGPMKNCSHAAYGSTKRLGNVFFWSLFGPVTPQCGRTSAD